MRLILLGCLLATALVGFVVAQESKRKDGDVEEVEKAEIAAVNDELSRAMKDKDADTLRRILADGWAYTSERGKVLTKDEFIANILKNNYNYDTVKHDDVSWHFFGSTVVTMGRSTSTLYYDGRVSPGPRRFLLVFTKMDGTWKQIAHIVALVPKD